MLNATVPDSAAADEEKKIGASFCVPTYNRLDTLVQAVESILAVKGLEGIDYEILVSDDSDNGLTEEYVLRLASSNGKIRYLKNALKGQFNNLNNLINNARFPWIVFLHDDDKLHPDYLTDAFRECLREDMSVDIVWTGRRYVNGKGEGIKIVCAPGNAGGTVTLSGKEYFEQMLSRNNYNYFKKVAPPMVTGLAVRKSLLGKSGLFDDRFEVNGDGLFLWKIFFFSDKAVYVNKPFIDYTLTDDTERAKPSRKGIVFHEMRRLLAALLDFLKPILGESDYAKKKKEYELNFYRNALNINGPILWTALRYDGGYSRRIAIQSNIFYECVSCVPGLLFSPKAWSVFAVSFLPQGTLMVLYKKLYNREIFKSRKKPSNR